MGYLNFFLIARKLHDYRRQKLFIFQTRKIEKKHVHAAYIFSNRDKIYFFKPTDFPSFAK